MCERESNETGLGGSRPGLPRRGRKCFGPPGFAAGLVLAIGLLGFGSPQAEACSVPVFRYALERFETDPYQFVVFHRGPLAPDAKPLTAALEQLATDDSMPLHIQVRMVDLAAAPKSSEKLAWTPPPTAALPWLAVVSSVAEDALPIWTGPLRGEDLRALIDSPARRELANRLLKGESAVFVLLESGDKKADDQAAKLLQATLASMEKTLQLPIDDGTGQLRSELPLRIAFTVLRVSRGNSAERHMVKLLLALGDAAPETKGPIVFPVFGRGRVLAALSGSSLSASSLEEVGDFLCGNCTCSVKGQLPGGDLLMVADWEALIEGRMVREEPLTLQGLAPLAQTAASFKAAKPAAPARASTAPAEAVEAEAQTPDSHSGPLFWTLLATLTGVALVIAAGSLFLRNMRGKDPPA